MKLFKNFKPLFLSLPALFVVISLLGCGTGDDKENNGGKAPSQVVISQNMTTLFVGGGSGSKKLSTGRSDEESGTLTGAIDGALLEMLDDGTIQEVSFQDEEGNVLPFEVLKIIKLSEDYVGLYILEKDLEEEGAGSGEGYKFSIVIDRNNNNAVLDFSSYDLTSSIMYEGFLYAIGAGANTDTLYKIDLASREATPLNNPDYNPVYEHILELYDSVYGNKYYDFIITSGGYVHVNTKDTSFLDIPMAFYSSGGIPKYSGIGGDLSVGGGTVLGLMVGEDYQLYRLSATTNPLEGLKVNLDCLKTVYDSQNPLVETLSSMEVHSDASVSDYASYAVDTFGNNNIYEAERYIVCIDGYIKTTVNGDGSVSAEFTSNTYPAELNDLIIDASNQYSEIIVGDKLYWKDGDVFKMLDIDETNPSIIDIATVTDVINWIVVGENIIYHAYINGSGVDIGTYELKTADGNSTLLKDSKMEIENIVEFEL